MKVLISTGGTLGHILPAINIAEVLLKENNKVIILTNKPYSFCTHARIIPALPPDRINIISYKNIKFIISLLFSLLISFWYVIKFRPEVVLGMGSYASIPPLIVAYLLKIPIILHEQNIIIGSSNKLLLRFATKLALTFDSLNFNSEKFNNKITVIGSLIRRRKYKKARALSFLGLSEDKFTLLVFGGSQGATSINKVIINLLNRELDEQIQFIFITGKNKIKNKIIEEKILLPRDKLYITEFIEPEYMDYVYSAADIVICRAGANTIAEIIYFNLPAIIIPYPYAALGHQLMNANYIKKNDAGVVILEEDLSAKLLSSIIKELFTNREKLEKMRQNLACLNASMKNGIDNLKNLIYNLKKK